MKLVKRMTALTLAAILSVTGLAGCGNEDSGMPEVEAIDIMAESKLTDADFLKADGRDLKNNSGAGDIVNLRGVNLGDYLVQELWMSPTAATANVADQTDILNILTERFGEEEAQGVIDVWEENFITEQDFINLSEMGVNCVRLPFWWRNFMDAEGNFLYYDEKAEDPYAYAFRRLDYVLQMAGKYGIYVILDMHGAPGSQNGSDHSGVDGGDNKVDASQFFFGDSAEANQELYYKLWEVIADRYKGNPIVAGYDLLNEPYCTYRYNSPKGMTDNELHELLWGVYDEAYKRIRAIDPDHCVIMEATWDATDLPDPAEYSWENVMYEYHNYLYDDYDNAAGQQIKNMVKKLNGIYSANYNVPSLMGEFNYFNNNDAWDEGLKLLTEAGVNWTIWTYKTCDSNGNWGFYHHPGSLESKVNLEKMELDEIKDYYSQVGTDNASANEKLNEIVSSWCKAPVQNNLLGK